jgi:hypothetical protein
MLFIYYVDMKEKDNKREKEEREGRRGGGRI